LGKIKLINVGPSAKMAKNPPTTARGQFFEKIKMRNMPREESRASFKKSLNEFFHRLSLIFSREYS